MIRQLQNRVWMPAEWEEHEATWLSWPKNEMTFPGKVLEEVRLTFAQMIAALCRGEKVKVLVDSEKQKQEALSYLNETDNVFFILSKTEDVWIRDYGPIFVRSGSALQNSGHQCLMAMKWIFNAWGKKYDDLLPDNSNGMEVARLADYQIIEPGIVLEGGSIDVNGNGMLLTTKQCLLNKNRNGGLEAKVLEKYFSDFLGASKVIWLGSGIEGDDTDGHIDDIARFVGNSRVICMVDDQDTANRKILHSNYEMLCHMSDQNGNPLEVIPLSMPKKAVVDSEGNKLPASYANFYIANSAVLVPIFGDTSDDNALEVISAQFPNRTTVGINCEDLVSGFGAIHCVTQQQPKL